MAREISDLEQEALQNIVQRIATHIVEGSAALQELRATIANLKNSRSNLDCVVAHNWLSASKIIQKAGKDTRSWENFLNALRITYGNDKAPLNSKDFEGDVMLFENSCQELWSHEITKPTETRIHNTIDLHTGNTVDSQRGIYLNTTYSNVHFESFLIHNTLISLCKGCITYFMHTNRLLVILNYLVTTTKVVFEVLLNIMSFFRFREWNLHRQWIFDQPKWLWHYQCNRTWNASAFEYWGV